MTVNVSIPDEVVQRTLAVSIPRCPRGFQFIVQRVLEEGLKVLEAPPPETNQVMTKRASHEERLQNLEARVKELEEQI